MNRPITVGNKVCAARVHKRYEEQRMQRIKDIKPSIDMARPKTIGMAHLKTNFKRNEEMATRHDLIERDNRIMLGHMNTMMHQQGEYTITKSTSLPHLRNRVPGGRFQLWENERIRRDNEFRATRLQTMQPETRPSLYEEDYKRSTDYVYRICEYPPPLVKYGKPPRVKAPKRDLLGNKLKPLPKEEPSDDEEEEDDEDEEEEEEEEDEDDEDGSQASGAVNQDGLRYVKRTQLVLRDDEGPYKVDLATDGQRLMISAYNEDTELTLEMLVKKETHKRLLDEADGDYSAIADRLRIDGDHLVIDDL